MTSSIIIMAIIALNSVIVRVSGDYQLILSQKDVRLTHFSANVKSTSLENAGNPNANTFTNIGNLDPANFIGANGFYRFKLVYTNLHDEDEENKINNGDSVTLEWKQTSWLTAETITGYKPINVPTQTRADSGSDFEGLGLSSQVNSFLDGDAYGDSNFWNSVGTIHPFLDGIPAFDRQIAFAAALYVYSPPDCSNHQIDDYLLQCSTLFPPIYSAAYTPPIGLIENDSDEINDDGLWTDHEVNGKDILIISLLLINLIGMIYSHYRIQSKERRSFHGKKYAVQFDEETDMEPINK